jgi:hypothetical protein
MITEDMVTRFALRAERLKKITKFQKDLRELLISEMKAGCELPETGPFTLLLSPNGGKELDWKVEYFKLRVEQLKKDDGYKTKVAEAVVTQEMIDKYNDAPDKESEKIAGESYVGGVKLQARPNPKYKKVAAA